MVQASYTKTASFGKFKGASQASAEMSSTIAPARAAPTVKFVRRCRWVARRLTGDLLTSDSFHQNTEARERRSPDCTLVTLELSRKASIVFGFFSGHFREGISMKSNSQPSKPRAVWLFEQFYALLSRWIVLPLLSMLVGAVIISRVANWYFGTYPYKIYIVGNMNDPFSVAKQINDGFIKEFESRNQELENFEGGALTVGQEDDRGDPARARQIAEKIARQPDTLMVIGHTASGQSKEALPIYLATEPPIPVILPTETNPDLIPAKIKKHRFRPVFRLLPTDKVQAQTAADFVEEQAATSDKSIWVVQDLSGIGNHVYSSYLADEFVKDVGSSPTHVVLWSNNLSAPSPTALIDLNIGWVFFPGGWRPALVLIRELRKLYQKIDKVQMPRIVLSDASAEQMLITGGGSDVEDVYLTYPMRVEEKGSDNSDSVYGQNAARVIEGLIEDDNNSLDSDVVAEQCRTIGYHFRSLMGIKRVGDARCVLGALMQEAEEDRRSFLLSNDKKIAFGVDEDGEDGVRVDKDATFYVWQVKGQGALERFTDVTPYQAPTMAATIPLQPR
jgi:branched-chain amino acid transport system substrate-binding protein